MSDGDLPDGFATVTTVRTVPRVGPMWQCPECGNGLEMTEQERGCDRCGAQWQLVAKQIRKPVDEEVVYADG